LPIEPSKINEKIKYKIVSDMNEIYKMDVKDVIKHTNKLSSITGLNFNITHKILDLKIKKNIIAVINKNNRLIPVKVSLNNSKDGLKISHFNYYSDLEESLENKIEKSDNRIEQVNRKNFEDETYMRMKFELSKFLQIRSNKVHLDNILDIIHSETKDIAYNRKKLYKILHDIYNLLVHTGKDKDINFYDYVTPNKRIPCFLRNNKGYNKENNVNLDCNDDPHCIVSKKECKLYLNTKNLLDLHKNFNNYNYYLSKIVDELLRYKTKRNEILEETPAI
jgi:hypothetical protein